MIIILFQLVMTETRMMDEQFYINDAITDHPSSWPTFAKRNVNIDRFPTSDFSTELLFSNNNLIPKTLHSKDFSIIYG